MQHLIKVILKMALIFIVIFIIAKVTGVLSVDQVKSWLIAAKKLSPAYMSSIVILLLITDLMVTVPTMTIIGLAGYFLGFSYGLLASMAGLMAAGIIGYELGALFGQRFLSLLLKNKKQQDQAKSSFARHGSMMIILARAVPMLPEISAYLAGMTKMPFRKFIVAWFLNTLPYSLLISYAGSISSVDDPQPAFYTAIGISTTLWIGWFLFNKRHRAAF
ncbi:MAG TPA: DedA family protein [Saprospiraceae bacterium]|nr:DedA family protein [Saprospiraceae bacterium]